MKALVGPCRRAPDCDVTDRHLSRIVAGVVGVEPEIDLRHRLGAVVDEAQVQAAGQAARFALGRLLQNGVDAVAGQPARRPSDDLVPRLRQHRLVEQRVHVAGSRRRALRRPRPRRGSLEGAGRRDGLHRRRQKREQGGDDEGVRSTVNWRHKTLLGSEPMDRVGLSCRGGPRHPAERIARGGSPGSAGDVRAQPRTIAADCSVPATGRPIRTGNVDGIDRPTMLRIGRQMFDAVVAHLTAGLPNEAVGLLAVRDEGPVAVAVHFYPGTNVDGSPTRYTMEPAEVLAAFRDIAANEWRFGAIVHSHPATPPAPSETDLREAFYPEALLVIVGLANEVPAVRAWRVEFGSDGTAVAAVEVDVEIDEASPEPPAAASRRPA